MDVIEVVPDDVAVVVIVRVRELVTVDDNDVVRVDERVVVAVDDTVDVAVDVPVVAVWVWVVVSDVEPEDVCVVVCVDVRVLVGDVVKLVVRVED